MFAQALSWLFSPILAAVSAFLLFGAIRTFILRSDNAFKRSIVLLPLFVFVTFFTVTYFIIARYAQPPCSAWGFQKPTGCSLYSLKIYHGHQALPERLLRGLLRSG